MLINNNTKDILIDPQYGDFIINTDVKYVRGKTVLLNTILERLNTNHGDFRLEPDSGADLERFIGAGIDSKLISNMKLSIQYSLTRDNLISSSDIEILALQVSNNNVIFRIIVTIDGSEITLTKTFRNEDLND